MRTWTVKPDADIATRGSAAHELVIATREDLTILRGTRQLVSGHAADQKERS